jgi:type IV pilus biogenesis protein CpaD/CtpE
MNQMNLTGMADDDDADPIKMSAWLERYRDEVPLTRAKAHAQLDIALEAQRARLAAHAHAALDQLLDERAAQDYAAIAIGLAQSG